MNEKILVNELVKDKNVGAVASTSIRVTKYMINKIDFDNAKLIVEYGPGKGVITRHILSQMREDAALFVFETNENFIHELAKINDKRLIIINSDAENAKMILKNRYKIEQADYIISTIPLTFLDRKKRRRIISRSYTLLKEKGKFITYQYSWLNYNLIKERFSESRIKFILLNILPAFIFVGIK